MRTNQPFDKDTAREVADLLGMLKAPRTQAVPVLRGRKAQDHDAWELARDAGVGASDIGILLGHSSFSSRYALWWQKHLHWRIPQDEAMADGHAHEPMILAQFMEQHPELIVRKPAVPLWAHPQYPWAICTPDALAVMRGEPMVDRPDIDADEMAVFLKAIEKSDPYLVPVELKWDASPGWGPSGGDDVPEQYRLQVMWQAWIFGAPGGWLVRRAPSGRNRYREYWIPVDEDKIRLALAAAQSFVASLETGVSPEPDGTKATEEALRHIHAGIAEGKIATVPPAIAAEWEEARDAVRAAAQWKQRMDNTLRELMADAEKAMDTEGRVFAKRRVGKRAGYTVAPATVDELRRVNDGSRDEGGSIPAADGPEGDDAPAGEAGGQEALEGGSGDHGAGAAGGPDEAGAGPDSLPGVRGDDRAQDGLLEADTVELIHQALHDSAQDLAHGRAVDQEERHD